MRGVKTSLLFLGRPLIATRKLIEFAVYPTVVSNIRNEEIVEFA